MTAKTRAELNIDLSTGGSSDNKIETKFAKDLLDSITLSDEGGGGGDLPSADFPFVVGNANESGGTATAVELVDFGPQLVDAINSETRRQATFGVATTMSLPPESVITGVIVHNASGADVTGGIKLGNSSGGTQYIGSLAANDGETYYVTSYDFARTYVATGASTLYVDAVTDWNGAEITLTVFVAKL